MPRIAVPADKVRTPSQILAGVTIIGSNAWLPCSHCGGSGNYPSSMIPPGKCRYYCWENRTPETYGKRPVEIGTYVKREQAADRRAYRAQVKWEQDAPARAQAAREQMARDHEAALAEDAQRADEAARRAVSEYVGQAGERLELRLTVRRVASYETVPFGSYSRNRVTHHVLTLRDVAGNVFVWFSGYTRYEQGTELQLRGTVKEHKEYQGEKQTIIQRVKVAE